MTEPTVVVVTTPPPNRRWQWLRVSLDLILAVAVACLVVLVIRDGAQLASLQAQLTATTAERAQQVDRLTSDLAGLQASLDRANRLTAAKDAEIRRLALLVVQLGGDPTLPAPAPTPPRRAGRSPSPQPQASATPAARRPAALRAPPASPGPTPTLARSPGPLCPVLQPLGLPCR